MATETHIQRGYKIGAQARANRFDVKNSGTVVDLKEINRMSVHRAILPFMKSWLKANKII